MVHGILLLLFSSAIISYSLRPHRVQHARLPGSSLLGASSARGKGHEEGGLAYTMVGSSLRSPPGNSQASTPKTRVCLLSALTLRGAVPHYLSLKKELAYSSS